MSLIKCKECGSEVSEKAKTCPKCGCPVDFSLEKAITKKKDSKLSVWSAVLSIFTVTCPIAFVIAIVDLSRKDNDNRHLGSWFAILFFLLFLIVIL